MEKNYQAAPKPAVQNKPSALISHSTAGKVNAAKTSGKKMYDGVKDMLFLIDYLVQNSSPEHKVSEAELMMALFRYKNPNDIRSNKVYNTSIGEAGISERVKRFLKLFTNSDVFSFLKIKESNEKFKGTKNNALKYYVQGPLSESTIRILRDAIAVYPYAEQKITKQIIEELNNITNIYNRREYNLPAVDAFKFPGTYYDNLQEIYRALSTSTSDEKGAKLDKKEYNKLKSEYENSKKHSKKVSRLQFEYCMYDYDDNREKITLVTRPVKKNGEITNIREVNPLILTWSNGYYYLVTYAYFNDEYHYYNYRVDRMKNVKCLKQDADEYNDRTYFRGGEFDPKLYIAKHPVMYSSTKIYDQVEIRCKRFVLNNALDTFGFDINVLKCEGDEVVFTVNNLTGQGVLMWALEYCEHCEILNPTELRAEMKRYAELMVKKYEE
ncbi:MAG: helix-turn-helix transcriptional regulator [Oscillospiraceae bacterium]